MSSSGAATINGWARDVSRFADDLPGASIGVVERAIEARLRADTGGDGALSHGRNLGRATTSTTVSNGEAIVVPSGSRNVWGILQGGTQAHVVRAKPGSFLATPYGPRAQVHVGRSRARHTFTEGATIGLDAAQRDVERRWAAFGS